jgi:hypothetical protein
VHMSNCLSERGGSERDRDRELRSGETQLLVSLLDKS